ncbi:putative gypsy-type retrotransposon [Panicum miliaceum]|uniref:Gypsy-type retrotransposon n=1 Tax=Panicum miliaceum TaxID=4540 RepID=A0A3L6RU30_PANMI|nr:putative gypsy-type retrotransposon [Panicum miliaceum]
MPRKSAAGRGRKREGEGGEESPPPTKRQECWLEKLTEEESRDIAELMKRIQALKDKGVTGESVAYPFIEQHIQPLQQCVHLGFEYQGIHNPSLMARDVPSVEEIMRRVTCLFTGVHSEPYIPKQFGAGNSPNPPTWSGSGLTYLSGSPRSQPKIRLPRRPRKTLQQTRRTHNEWQRASGGPLQL